MKERVYESDLVQIMIRENISLSSAMVIDAYNNNIDASSVFAMTDYLEERFEQDMDKVEYYMLVFSGIEPDLRLKRIDDVKEKDKTKKSC